jgi:DNA-binding NarL/FixJ family response regulator
VKVIAVSQSDERDLFCAALSAGAISHIVKYATPRDLVDIVRHSAAGVVYPAARVQSAEAGGESDPDAASGPVLTRCERTILSCVAQGTTTREINNELRIRDQTVNGSSDRHLLQTRSGNRSSAVRHALEHGLVACARAGTRPAFALLQFVRPRRRKARRPVRVRRLRRVVGSSGNRAY